MLGLSQKNGGRKMTNKIWGMGIRAERWGQKNILTGTGKRFLQKETEITKKRNCRIFDLRSGKGVF